MIHIKGKTVKAIEVEVPGSVTQFDPAAIEALGAQNISDLAQVTPNVEIRTTGSTAATFFIRGVGLSDFNANAAGAVAIYQDGVAMNSPALQLGQLFDLEAVDVLRGPQGSGAGRNASAGAIKIRSRKPTGDFSAALRVALGNSSEDTRPGAGFASRDFEGALEVPLIEETLATRLAFRFTQKDPFGKNGCVNPPVRSADERAANPDPQRRRICGVPFFFAESKRLEPASIRKVNDSDNWAARGQLRFQPPGTNMDWLLNIHGSRLDQQSTLAQAIGTTGGDFGAGTSGLYRDPDIVEMESRLLAKGLTLPEARKKLGRDLARNLDIRPYRGDYNRVGQTKLDTWGGFLRGDWSNGGIEFTTITGYDGYDRSRETDTDSTPLVLFESTNGDNAWQFTQDLRMAGDLADQTFRWDVGGYYLMEVLHSDSDTFFSLGTQNALQKWEQDTWSFGIYGSFVWDFLDDFTLEGGVRYNWERKDFDFLLTRSRQTRAEIDSKIWTAPTGSISLTYRFTPEIAAYTKFSRGWKGGHFNASANIARAIAPAKPETIDAWETGLRGRFADGRLSLAGAFFYYRYKDYQVFLFENNLGAPPLLQIINADDAEVFGAELDVQINPLEGWVPETIEGLSITGRFSWLESQFLDFTNTTPVFDFGTIIEQTTDFSGNQLINSPRWKASLSVAWRLDFGHWGLVIPRYDAAWSDDIFFDPTEGRGVPSRATGKVELPKFAIGQRAFWLHNLRLAYQTEEGNMEIAAWVRNLENTVYKTYAFDASAFSEVVVNFVGQPRTYGLTLAFKW